MLDLPFDWMGLSMSMETMQQRIQVSGILKGHGYFMKVRICAVR